ncbi:uncharacterized protein LOC126293152 [Schistocerca gregaria]|uniref:uncharacterized protein LOC126293152 n=1 Tax=Schistocerca gregaria TaxID=7010 RepID=UPI00211F392F|nr:uncharacterized protein LOC126293152 [Schistocerca gregaria]
MSAKARHKSTRMMAHLSPTPLRVVRIPATDVSAARCAARHVRKAATTTRQLFTVAPSVRVAEAAMEKIELRNRTFMRWLLKCGRQRRQLLLRELRSDLVNNGFHKLQLRKALRQLAQQTVVSLERLTNREIDLHTKRKVTSDSDYYESYTQKHYKKCYTSSECNKPNENMNEEKHKHKKDQECATYNHLTVKTVNSLKRRCEGSHHTVEKSIGRAKFKKFKDRTETELHKYEKSTHFTTEQYFFDKTNIKNMEKYGDSKGETAKNSSILQITKERPDSFAGKRTSDASCNIGRDCSFTEEKHKKNSYQDKARYPVHSVNNTHTSKATVQTTEYPSSKNCHGVGRTMLKLDVSKVLKETSVNEQTVVTAAPTPEIIKGILSRDVSMAQQCHESVLCDLTSTSSIVAKKSVNMCSSAEFLTSSKKNKSSEQMLSLPLGTFRPEIRTSPNILEDGDRSSSHDDINARTSNDTKMEQPVVLPVSIDLKDVANRVESLTAVTEQKNGAVVTSTIESMKGNSCTLSNKLSTDCDDIDTCKSSSKTSVNGQISYRHVQELSEKEVEDQESIERSLKLESGVECDRDNLQNVVCVPFMFENNSIQTQGSLSCEHPNNIHGSAKLNHSTTEDHSKMLTKVELASSSTLGKCDTSGKDNLSFHPAPRTQLVKPSSANDKDVAVTRNNKCRLSLENKVNDSATSELKDNIKSSAESEITSPASSTTKTFVEKQDKMSQSLFSGSTNNQSGHATTKRENNSPDGFVSPQISDTVHDIKVHNKTSCLTVQRNTARSPETKEQLRLTPVCRQIPHDSGSSMGKQGSNAENGNRKECTMPLEPSISIEAVDQLRNNGESRECEFVITKDHSVKHMSTKTKTAGKTEAETLLKRPYIHEESETDSQAKCFKEQSRAPESFKRKLKLSQKFEELFGADECEADSITGEQKNGQKMCKTKNISEVSKEIPQIGNKSTALHTTKQLPGEGERKLMPSNRGIRVAKKSPLFLCNKTRTICKGQPIGFVSKVKLNQRKEQSLVNAIAKRGSSDETVAGKSQDSERSQSAKEKVMQNWFSDATNPPACSKSRLMTKDTAVNPHNIPWLLKEVDLSNVSIKSRKHYFRQSSVEPQKPVVAKVGLHKRNSFPPMPNNKHAGTDEPTFVREDIFSSPVQVRHHSDTELNGMNVNDKPERRIESCESLLTLETSNVCEEIGALRNAEGERDICTFSEKDVLPDSHKISPSSEKVEIENAEVFLTSMFVKDEEKVLDQNEELVAEPLSADISDVDEKTFQCNNLDTSDAQCWIKAEFSSVESFPELNSVSLKLPNCGHSDAETENGSSPNFSLPELDPVNSSFGSRNDTKTIESTPLGGGSSCALVVGCGNNLESPEKGSAEKEIMETSKGRATTERLCSEIVHTNESGMSVSTKETEQTSLAGPEVNLVIRTGNKEQGPKESSAVITEEERRDIGTLKGKVNNFSNEASSKARKENLRVIHNATGNESGINKKKQENLRSELQLGEKRLQHDDAGAIPNITMADCSPSLKIKIGSIRVKDPLSLGIGCKLSESDAATHLIENSVKSFPTQIENEFTDLASLFVTGFMDIDRYKARMNDAEKLPETSRDIELTCARTDFVHSVRSKCRVVVNKVKFLKFFFPDKFEEVLHAFVNKRWQCTTQELAELYQRFLKEQSKNLSVGTEKSSYTQSEKTKVIVNIEGGNDAPFESQSFVCEVQNSQKHYSKTATAKNVGRDEETTGVCIQSGKSSWERTSFTIPSVNRHGYQHSVTEMSPNVTVLSQQSNVVGGSSAYNLTIHQKVLGTDNLTTDTSQVGSQSTNKPSEEVNDAVNAYHSCNSRQGSSNNVNEGINSSLQPVMMTSDTSLHAKNKNANDIVSSQTERQVTMLTPRSRHNCSVRETSSCTSILNDNGLMRALRYHTTQHQPASIQSLQSLIEQMPASRRQISHNVSEQSEVGILSQDQNRLSFPPSGQPQHGSPAPGQPQHGSPAPGQPQHGCPAPGQPQHGCPAPGQPQHGCPAPGQPQHGCPAPGQPQHGCPAPGQPQHGCPAPGQPQHGCPAPGQPQHGCPAPGQPQHGCPAPGQPQHGCPAPGQPQHGCPAPGQPQHGCPAPGQPQHGCPAPGQPQHGCPPQRRAPLPGYLQHGWTPTSQQQHINVTSGQLQSSQISSKSKSVLIRYLSRPKGGAQPLNTSQLQEGRMLSYTSQPQMGCRPSYPRQAQAGLLPSYQNGGQVEQLLLKQIPQQDSYLRLNHCQLPSYQTQQQYGSRLSSQNHTVANHITQGQAVNGHQSSNQSLRSSQNLSKTGNVPANQSQTHWAHVSSNSNSVRTGYMPSKQPQVGSIPSNVNQPHFESSHVRDLQVKRGYQIPAYVSQLQTGHQTAGQENLNHQQLNRTFQQMSYSTTQASQVSPVHTQATQMIHQRKLHQIAPNFEQTRSMVATVPQGAQLPPYTVHVSQVPANPTNTAVMGHMTANCGMTGLVLSQQIAAVPPSSKVLDGLCFSGAQAVTVQSGTTSTTLISTHQNTFQSAPNVNSIRRQGSSHSEGRIGYQGTETSLPSHMSSSVEDQGNRLSCLAVGQDCGVKETQSADENRGFANLPALGRQPENQQDVRLQCIEQQSNKTSFVIQNNRASNSRAQQKIASTSHVHVIGGSQRTIPSGTQGTGSRGYTVSSAKIMTAEPQSAEVIFPRTADSSGVNSQVQKSYRTAAMCEIPNSSQPVICNTMSQNSVAGSSGECPHQQVHISRRHPNILSTQSTNPKNLSSLVSTSAKQSGMLYVTSSENNEVPTNSSVPSLQKAATSQSQLVFRTLGIMRHVSSAPAVSVSSTDSLERDTQVTSADKDQHASRVKLPQTVVANNSKDSSPSARAEADKLSQQIYTDTVATSASTRTDIIKSGSTSCPAVSPRASVPHDHAPHSHSVCGSSNADSVNEGNLLHSLEHPDVLNVSCATGVKQSRPPLTQCDRHTGQSPVTVKDTNTSSTSNNNRCLLQPAGDENTEIRHNFQASAVQMKIPVSSSDISYSPQLFDGCKTQSDHEKASSPNSVTYDDVSLSSGASSSIGPPIMNSKNNTYLEKLSGAHAMTSCTASVNIVSISAAKTVSSGNGMDTNNSSITEKQGNASSAFFSSKEAESCKNLSQPERTQNIQGNTPCESKTVDGANGNMSTVRVETISNTGANKSVAPKTDEVVQESNKQMSEIFDSDCFPAANAVQLKHILTSESISNVTDHMEEMDVKEFIESDLSVNSEMSLKLMSRVCFDNKKELTSDSAYLEIMDGRNQCAQTVSADVNIVNKKNNVPLEKKSGVNIDTPAVTGSTVSEDTALNCATKAMSPGYDADGENSFLTEKREKTISKLRSPCIVSSRQSQNSDLDNSESEITVVNCLSEDDDIEIIEDCSPVQFLGYKFAKVGVATKTTSRSRHISVVAPADSFTKHLSSKSEDISCANDTQEAVGDSTSAKTGSKDTNNETSETQCLKIVSVVSLTSEAMEESEIQWPSSPEPRTVSRDSGYTTPSEGAGHDAQEIHIDGDVHCAFCDNTAQILCTGCYITCYCSADCQARHWREVHYEECKQQNAVGNNQVH